MDADKTSRKLIAETLREHAVLDVPHVSDPWPLILERLNSATRALTGSPQVPMTAPTKASAVRRVLSPRSPETSDAVRKGRFSRLALSSGALAICLVVVATMTMLPSAGTPTGKNTISSFVPEGKVRHQVFSDTVYSAAINYITTATTHELWIGNGKSHLLVRENENDKGDYWLLGENTVWSYKPTFESTLVYTSPYAQSELKLYTPNPNFIAEMQQEIGAHIASTDTIEGRQTTVVERSYIIPAGSPVDPASGGVQLYRFWIDSNTNELVRTEHDIRESANGLYTDKVDIYISTMVVDELLDANQVSSDLFTFVQPPGTWVIRDQSISNGP